MAARARPSTPALAPLGRRTLLAWALLIAACGGGGSGSQGGGQARAGDDPPPAAPLPEPVEATGTLRDLVARPGGADGRVRLVFTVPEAPAGTTLAAYEARHATAPLDAQAIAQAAPVFVGAPPGVPGTLQTVELAGFEPGQHHQFVLRVVRADGSRTPWSHAVEVRAPGSFLPQVPADAIGVFAPGALGSDGGYYLLQEDVVAAGDGFRIEGRDITLDLGGHTLTYGAGSGDGHHGVVLDGFTGSGSVRIVRGRIVQGGGGGRACHAVNLAGGHDLRLSDLHIEVSGPDAMGIAQWSAPSGSLRIDHCRVTCNTTVVGNRHWPGVGAIWLDRVEGALEVDHNLVIGSPQWGIRVAGPESRGPCRIHHNLVRGTKALVANGYMLGIHKPDAEVFENDCRGESRGVHVDTVDNDGRDAHLRFNRWEAQDQPNAEFPQHWCHGIKLEEAAGARVHHNYVRVVADRDHAEALGLDLDLATAGDEQIHDNRIAAVSLDGVHLAKALNWTAGSSGDPAAFGLRHNVFSSTDYLVQRAWHSGSGRTFRENAWLADPGRPAGFDPLFERFDNRDGQESLGHGFVDPISERDTALVSHWQSPGPYRSTRWRTLSVRVRRGAAPAAGARVELRDAEGTLVAAGYSDAAGWMRTVVAVEIVSNGPTLDRPGPFRVLASGGGQSAAGETPLAGRAAALVDLEAGTLSWDATPPGAPADPVAVAASCSRAALNWEAAEDEGGVVLYEIHRDGRLHALSATTRALVAGLEPGATHVFAVRARDAGGNAGPFSSPVELTLPAESRGP